MNIICICASMYLSPDDVIVIITKYIVLPKIMVTLYHLIKVFTVGIFFGILHQFSEVLCTPAI